MQSQFFGIFFLVLIMGFALIVESMYLTFKRHRTALHTLVWKAKFEVFSRILACTYWGLSKGHQLFAALEKHAVTRLHHG